VSDFEWLHSYDFLKLRIKDEDYKKIWNKIVNKQTHYLISLVPKIYLREILKLHLFSLQ